MNQMDQNLEFLQAQANAQFLETVRVKFDSKTCYELLKTVDLGLRSGPMNRTIVEEAIENIQKYYSFVGYINDRADLFDLDTVKVTDKNREILDNLRLSQFMMAIEACDIEVISKRAKALDPKVLKDLTIFSNAYFGNDVPLLNYLLENRFHTVNNRDPKRPNNSLMYKLARSFPIREDAAKFLIDKGIDLEDLVYFLCPYFMTSEDIHYFLQHGIHIAASDSRTNLKVEETFVLNKKYFTLLNKENLDIDSIYNAVDALFKLANEKSGTGVADWISKYSKTIPINGRCLADGNTALHLALLSDNQVVTRQLWNMGANYNLRNKENMTALDLSLKSTFPYVKLKGILAKMKMLVSDSPLDPSKAVVVSKAPSKGDYKIASEIKEVQESKKIMESATTKKEAWVDLDNLLKIALTSIDDLEDAEKGYFCFEIGSIIAIPGSPTFKGDIAQKLFVQALNVNFEVPKTKQKLEELEKQSKMISQEKAAFTPAADIALAVTTAAFAADSGSSSDTVHRGHLAMSLS